MEFTDEDFARADEAVAAYVRQNIAAFGQKIEELQARWLRAPDEMLQGDAAQLRAKAHELAGLGTMFGFPIVTSIAQVLRQLAADCNAENPIAQNLIGLCISTMVLVVRDEIKDGSGPKWEQIMGPINLAFSHVQTKSH